MSIDPWGRKCQIWDWLSTQKQSEIHNLSFTQHQPKSWILPFVNVQKALNGTFLHLENTPSHQGKHWWHVVPSPQSVSRTCRQENQAILSFVHRPKYVWCMEMQTKPAANGMRLTLDKYNSRPVCVMLLKRGILHKNCPEALCLCLAYKTLKKKKKKKHASTLFFFFQFLKWCKVSKHKSV